MPDHDDIGTPADHAAELRRQAELCDDNQAPGEALKLRARADELDPTAGLDLPAPGANPRLHISPQLMADIAEYFGIDRGAAAAKINDALRVEGAGLAAGWRDVTLPPPTRDQHLDDEARASMDLMGEGTLAAFMNHGTVFAVLRDIADAEPLSELIDAAGSGETVGVACLYCRAEALFDASLEQLGHPVEHLVSCPWVRVTHIVGVKPDRATPVAASVCRCGHYEYDHETPGWRACSRRDACGCQLYTERGPDGG